jgi:hypothetical protein
MGLRTCLARLRRWLGSAPAAARKTPAPRRTALRLEQLEARDVPAVVPSQTYLASVYQGFLDRAIDAPGLSFWGARLAATNSREQTAAEILQSQEWHGRELQLLYLELLGRPLDTAGLRFWGNILETGGTYEQVKAGILGSAEYFARNGNTISSWMNAVYPSQLGRAPGPNDFSFVNTQLARGSSRTSITSQILASDEFHLVEMNGIYLNILSRPLDSAGANFWGAVLRNGATVDDVLAGVVGSPEFFNNLNAFLFANPITFNDPNVAADSFLNQFGKFSALFPGVEQLARFIVTSSSIRTAVVSGSQAAAVINASTVNVSPVSTATLGFTFTPGAFGLGATPFVGTGGSVTSPGFLLTAPSVLTPNPVAVSITGTNPTTSTVGIFSTTVPLNVNSTVATAGFNPAVPVSTIAPLTTTLPSTIGMGTPLSFFV